MSTKLLGINSRGLRVGESHQRAKLKDDEVALILELMEEADNQKLCGLPYLTDKVIAEKFEVSRATISCYRNGSRRMQSPTDYKLKDGAI